MYRLFSIFLILFTGLIFNACESDSDSDSDSNSDCLLYGTWELSYVDNGNGTCQYSCVSDNALPSTCTYSESYGSCLTVTVDDNGTFIGTDGDTSSGGGWYGDCSEGDVLSATMNGEELFGIIVSITSNELRIDSNNAIYVFEK